jgi:hypothetical protein
MTMSIDAEAILETLAKVRQSIPYPLPQLPPSSVDTAIENVEDFELATVAESLERLTAELSAAIDAAREKALSHALRVYYAAEELAADPANAHLIPHVEEMRRAFQHDYGVPIPPRRP